MGKFLHCTHYNIALAIHPESVHPAHRLYGGTIEVECLATVENLTPQAIRSIPFLLYRLLHVERVTDSSGQALSFTQKVTSLEKRPRQQVNFVTVSLPTPLPAGASTGVHLKYYGPICGYPEVFPYVQDHVSTQYTLLRTETLWFPIVGEPVDGWPKGAFHFNLSVVVPHNLVAVANGQLHHQSERSGGFCYQWRSIQPDPWGRLTIACAEFRQMAIAPGISLSYLPDDGIGAQVVSKAIQRTLELCTLWFGALPSHVLNIVEIPEGYGSEASPNLILQTADTFKAEHPDDPEAYRRAFSQVGHELVHLWNTPSREQYPSRFLDEGITHYIEALLLREEFGDEVYWQQLESYRSHFLSGGEAAISIPLAQAGLHLHVRDEIARGKGPWLLAVLHRCIGDQLLVGLRAFFDRYRVEGATLKEFQATMTQVAGVELARFFEEWLWSTKSSEYLMQKTEGRKLVTKLASQYVSAPQL